MINILKVDLKQNIKNCRFKSIISVSSIFNEWQKKFLNDKIEDPEFSLKCILSRVLNIDFKSVNNYTALSLTQKQKETFDRLCECRISRMPIQYVVGNWDFCNLTLKMMPPVFIPRPETEKLVELVVKDRHSNEHFNFLEVGCGTGAVSLAILKNLPGSTGVALDRSVLAYSLAKCNTIEQGFENRLNIIHHKLSSESLLPEALEDKVFDAIVSNPPYIKTKDIEGLPLEVKLYEDWNALNGGADGLIVIKLIFELARRHLKKEGKLWLEVDSSQIVPIENILKYEYNKSLSIISVTEDIFGVKRFLEIQKN